MKTNELKCTDLRIGNFLKYNNKIVEVFGLRPRYIEYYDEDEFLVGDNPEYFDPIELTEEVLVKIGFDAMHSSRYLYEKSIINKHNINDAVYITFHTINKTLRIDFSKDLQILSLYDIQYIHQLQNAYYCLTGEELNIEL